MGGSCCSLTIRRHNPTQNFDAKVRVYFYTGHGTSCTMTEQSHPAIHNNGAARSERVTEAATGTSSIASSTTPTSTHAATRSSDKEPLAKRQATTRESARKQELAQEEVSASTSTPSPTSQLATAVDANVHSGSSSRNTNRGNIHILQHRGHRCSSRTLCRSRTAINYITFYAHIRAETEA